MSLSRLLPKSAKNKKDSEIDTILYLFMVEFGWTYDKFIDTPIPIIFKLLKEHKRVKEVEQKAIKKK